MKISYYVVCGHTPQHKSEKDWVCVNIFGSNMKSDWHIPPEEFTARFASNQIPGYETASKTKALAKRKSPNTHAIAIVGIDLESNKIVEIRRMKGTLPELE